MLVAVAVNEYQEHCEPAYRQVLGDWAPPPQVVPLMHGPFTDKAAAVAQVPFVVGGEQPGWDQPYTLWNRKAASRGPLQEGVLRIGPSYTILKG